MKRLSIAVFIGTLSLFAACQKENTTQPTIYVLVEGSWQGTLDSNRIDITFIEGEFEGGPTLSGSAHLINSTQTIEYLIMNGTTNRTDSIWFSLYKVPVITKEDYHLRGVVKGNIIQGSFEQFDQNGNIVKSGTWQAQRIP
jgi:uncharacterized cupin superfamily protein